MDVCLEEDCVAGKGIPLRQDVVEVCFAFSTDVWQLSNVVDVEFFLDLGCVCERVFGVDVDAGVFKRGDGVEGGE